MATNNSPYSNKLWLIIALLFTFSVGILLGIKLQTQKTLSVVQSAKIEEVLRYTESWYIDDIDRTKLLQKAIESAANHKMTFSIKVTNSELNQLMQTIDKNFEGSGIDATIFTDTLLLLKPTKIGNGLIYKPY